MIKQEVSETVIALARAGYISWSNVRQAIIDASEVIQKNEQSAEIGETVTQHAKYLTDSLNGA